jgi:AraC-like DNA-binding protein
VRAFIQERRLGESLRELTSAGKTPRPLWEVARRWGFRDPAYFHRAFKGRFGITAGEAGKVCRIRKNADSAPVTSSLPKAKIAALHRWLEIMESEYQS